MAMHMSEKVRYSETNSLHFPRHQHSPTAFRYGESLGDCMILMFLFVLRNSSMSIELCRGYLETFQASFVVTAQPATDPCGTVYQDVGCLIHGHVEHSHHDHTGPNRNSSGL